MLNLFFLDQISECSALANFGAERRRLYWISTYSVVISFIDCLLHVQVVPIQRVYIMRAFERVY